MALSTFAETKVDRLPGRNPAFAMNSIDSILLIGNSKQTEILLKGYNVQGRLDAICPLGLSLFNTPFQYTQFLHLSTNP